MTVQTITPAYTEPELCGLCDLWSPTVCDECADWCLMQEDEPSAVFVMTPAERRWEEMAESVAVGEADAAWLDYVR